MNNSILPPEMHGGVVKISGYRGRGKTSFAIGAERPALTLFMDYEHKGSGFHKQLNFGRYEDMVAGCSSPAEVFDKTMNVIKSLEQDRYTHAIIDNGSPLELALTAGARRNLGNYCQEYGINYKNALAGRFGGVKPIVNFFIADKICNALFGKGVKLISVTHHIGARWASGGPIPNKKRVKGYDRWMELAILSVVIMNKGDFPPVPSAMVEKEQLSRMGFNEQSGEYEQVRCLPLRLSRCTYPAIKSYLASPSNLDDPAPGEALVPSEFNVFSERLDKEQIALMRLQLEKQRREEKDTEINLSVVDSGKAKQAKSLKAGGKSLPAIAKELGVTVAEVARMLK